MGIAAYFLPTLLQKSGFYTNCEKDRKNDQDYQLTGYL